MLRSHPARNSQLVGTQGRVLGRTNMQRSRCVKSLLKVLIERSSTLADNHCKSPAPAVRRETHLGNRGLKSNHSHYLTPETVLGVPCKDFQLLHQPSLQFQGTYLCIFATKPVGKCTLQPPRSHLGIAGVWARRRYGYLCIKLQERGSSVQPCITRRSASNS
ncbi:hypothetical protein BDV96DRAFT_136716 [Lophiotrema nucula]|uniref:Uncharacterized protein n=1 Tax=Lophiotrema nucula TaxID=690887 RepID=A0A6A5ZQT5_9PLEO|nr:hypothetical protein BDV96DRAFT_136716 [Lophiotrema nucula]